MSMFNDFRNSQIWVAFLSFCFLFSFSTDQALATHLVGSDISVTSLGNNFWSVQVLIYRDCNPQTNVNNTAFDQQIDYRLYDLSNNFFLDEFTIDLDSTVFVPIDTNNACIQLPEDLCLEVGYYTETRFLSPIAYPNGIRVNYQRCCFSSIDNVQDFPVVGFNVSATLTNEALAGGISTPKFDTDVPITFCVDRNEAFPYGSLTPDPFTNYAFIAPLSGAEPNNPTAFFPPPFEEMIYINGYTLQNPFEFGGSLMIDNDGLLTGTTEEEGFFILQVEASKTAPNSSTVLTTAQRAYRLLSSFCTFSQAQIGVADIILDDQSVICDNLTVEFQQNSINSSQFLWDFGVLTSDADTSNESSPSFTFPDFGEYTVQLFATDSFGVCKDSAQVNVSFVQDPDGSIAINNTVYCIENQDFQLEAEDNFAASIWSWKALDGGEIEDSTAQATSIVFPDTGAFQVAVVIGTALCSVEDTITLEVIREEPEEIEGVFTGCKGFEKTYNVSGPSFLKSYAWIVDGTEIEDNAPSVSYVFEDEGSYLITLNTFNTQNGCSSSTTRTVEISGVEEYSDFQLITDSTLLPATELGGEAVQEYQFSIAPDTNFSDDATFNWTINDGFPLTTPVLNTVFEIPGLQVICVEVNSSKRCASQCFSVIVPEGELFLPNAFSPNGDGRNEFFRPVQNRFVKSIETYELKIYNRWGAHIATIVDPVESWNGLDSKGAEVPQGLYHYEIEVESKFQFIRRTGEVLLVK